MVAYWTSTKTRKTDWDIIQVHCKHWNRKGWKKDFCMPENSLKGPHTCRMYEEKIKHYSVISGRTKRKIRIVCQKCQKESEISEWHEKHLIAKFTAQITLAEGYELMPENLTDVSEWHKIKNKAKEKLLECENWIQIFQIGVKDEEVELQSELNIKCSYGLAKCYLFRYFLENKSDLWSSGKMHLDYLVSTLPDDKSVREIEQLYIHNSPEVLTTMTKTERTEHIAQCIAKKRVASVQSLQEDRKMERERKTKPGSFAGKHWAWEHKTLNGFIDANIRHLENILYGNNHLQEAIDKLYVLHMVMGLSTWMNKYQRNESIDKIRDWITNIIDRIMQAHGVDYNLYKPSAYEWDGEISIELETHLEKVGLLIMDRQEWTTNYMKWKNTYRDPEYPEDKNLFVPIQTIITSLKDLQKSLGFESNRKPSKGALG